VKVRSVDWHDEAWEVHFDIKEGVYSLEDYPVRITHLGYFEVEGFAENLATVAEGLLRQHMRRGAVPPHAMVINWSRVLQLTQNSMPDVVTAVASIARSRYGEVESTVSNQF